MALYNIECPGAAEEGRAPLQVPQQATSKTACEIERSKIFRGALDLRSLPKSRDLLGMSPTPLNHMLSTL